MRSLFVALLVVLLQAGIAVAESNPVPKVRQGKYLLKLKNNPRKSFEITLSSASERRRPRRYHRRYNECFKLKRKNPNIFECEPDFLISAAVDDPFVFNCTQANNCNWGIENVNDTDIDLKQAWQITEGNPEFVVAVLDTGVDLTHPDLSASIWANPNEIAGNNIDDDNNGYIDDVHGINTFTGPVTNCNNNPNSPQDDNGHGTHVSGIIAAVKGNGIGISGVAPNVKILSVKILDCKGNGQVSNAVKAVEYITDLVVNHGIKIVVFNNSWGGAINEVNILRDAFQAASQAGILATAAAGNGGSDSIGDDITAVPFFPAKLNLDNVIAVAATDFSGRIATFSNFSQKFVHLAAPGGLIRSLQATGINFGTQSNGGTVLASGTSMSTPFVSGVIALMKSHLTGLNNIQIRDRLLNRVYPLGEESFQKVISGGRLNAYFALTGDEIPVPTPLPTYTPTPVITVLATATPESVPTFAFPTSTPLQTATPLQDLIAGEVSAKVKVFPVNLLNGSADTTNSISAKHANLLNIEISNAKLDHSFSFEVSKGSCLLESKTVTSLKSTSLLRLKEDARKLTNVSIKLKEKGGKVLFSEQLDVSDRPKNKKGQKAPKASCKVLKKNVIITDPNSKSLKKTA